MAGELVSAFQLARDGAVIEVTPALQQLLGLKPGDPSLDATPLPEFWHRHFLRPFVDDHLITSLRDTFDQPIIEAIASTESGAVRTLQLQPVDASNGTVTIAVNDISDWIEAQERLMRRHAHERFLHLVACDLVEAGPRQPGKVIDGLTHAMATYFNLAVAAVLMPDPSGAFAPRVLGFAAQSGAKFTDFESLMNSLGFDCLPNEPTRLDDAVDVWTVSLTSEQRQQLRSGSRDMTCIHASSLPAGASVDDNVDEVQLLALSTERAPAPADKEAIAQTLTHISTFVRTSTSTRPARARAETSLPTDPFACDLRDAVLNGELVVHYQPEFDLTTRQMVGAEALVRWPYQGRGVIPAGEFVPLVSQLGLSTALSEHVLNEACATTAAWLEQTQASDFVLRVNLSPGDVEDPGVVDTVLAALDRSGLPPSALCLEITESAMMNDYLAVLRHLNILAEAGISLALDDFGTGYSSMWLLRELPFDTLKIDQVFVRSVASGRAEDRAMIETMVSLGEAFNMTITAEGIETQAQLTQLLHLGVGNGQGFLLAKPAPKEDVLLTIDTSTDRRSAGTP